MNRGRRHAKEALHVGLRRSQAMEGRVCLDEGQVLPLEVGELGPSFHDALRGYPKSFVGVFWGLMRRLGNGTRVGCQATVSEASGGCC